MFKGVLFDLDGTLLDTRGDLAFCANRLFANHGIRQLQKEECSQFMGWGIKEFVRRSYFYATQTELDAETLEAYFQEFLDIYSENPNPDTVVYPGVLEGLKRLKESGIYVAVVTNKAQRIAVKVLKNMFDGLLNDFQGPVSENGVSIVPPKPDKKLVNLIIDRSGLQKSDFLYVGDSKVDMNTAFNSELPFAAVTWGYGEVQSFEAEKVKFVIEDFKQIIELV